MQNWNMIGQNINNYVKIKTVQRSAGIKVGQESLTIAAQWLDLTTRNYCSPITRQPQLHYANE